MIYGGNGPGGFSGETGCPLRCLAATLLPYSVALPQSAEELPFHGPRPRQKRQGTAESEVESSRSATAYVVTRGPTSLLGLRWAESTRCPSQGLNQPEIQDTIRSIGSAASSANLARHSVSPLPYPIASWSAASGRLYTAPGSTATGLQPAAPALDLGVDSDSDIRSRNRDRTVERSPALEAVYQLGSLLRRNSR